MRWDGVGRASNRVCPYVGCEILGSYAPLRYYHRPETMGLTSSKSDRTFKAAKAKGGCELVPGKTALVLIEYQF